MELGAQELEEVEGLQETLAEDLESHQESQGGKRDAEEVHVGTPTKKRKYAGQGKVKCDHCEKKYSSKNSLAAHLKKFHATIIKKELVVELSGGLPLSWTRISSSCSACASLSKLLLVVWMRPVLESMLNRDCGFPERIV